LATVAHINFQPGTGSPIPPGYFVDSGLKFGDRGNGFSYGWLDAPDGVTPTPVDDPGTRDRNVGFSPDQRWDTLDHFHKDQQSPIAEGNKVAQPTWWQINLPNGTYQVRVVAGDASNTDEHFIMYANAQKVNGVPIVADSTAPPAGFTGTLLFDKDVAGLFGAGQGTDPDHWADSGVVNVTVTDGTLTISEAANALNNKICFIDIDSQAANPPPTSPTTLSVTSTAASQVGLHWSDNSNNENGFRIETSADGVTFAPLTNVPPNTTDFKVAGLAPQTKYYFRVFAFNTTGDSTAATNVVNTTTVAPTGQASTSFLAGTAGTDIDLTGEGALDWVHWGLNDSTTFDHKNTATRLISDVTLVPGSPLGQSLTSPTTFSWSDGAPDPAASATNTELSSFGYDHGFSFTVPADTTLKVLRVYVGVRNFRGELTARLSDGSAADVVNSTFFNGDTEVDGIFTIPYKAASAGQTLTVTWAILPPDGDPTSANAHIYLKAAALFPPPPAPVGLTTNLAVTALSSGRDSLTWDSSGVTGSTGYIIERAPDNNGSPGTFAQVGQVINPATSFLDNGTFAKASTKYYYRVTPVNLANVPGTASSVASVTTAAGPFGDGAQATYYNLPSAPVGNDPTLDPVWPVTSIDPTINFDWGNGAPPGAGPGFQTDNFVVRWTAKIKPEFSGDYTFYADTDDGHRLIVNGQKLLDNLSRRAGLGTRVASQAITLTAGQTYDVIFDMDEEGGGAGARLYWSTDQLPLEIIPQATLFHQAPDTTPPKVLSVVMDGKLPPGAVFSPAQHLLIQFSENVGGSLIGDYITLIGDEGSVFTAGLLNVAFYGTSNTAVVTFPGAQNETIPDTNYQLFINGQGVTDGSGNLLDGNGDGTGGDDFAGRTFAFTGDANHDRTVDFNDLVKLAQNYNSNGGKSFEEGDFNHDGNVDFNDLVLLAQRYNTSLAPPAAAKPVQASTPLASPVPAATPVKPVAATKKAAPKAVKKAAAPAARPVLVAAPKAKAAFGTKRVKSIGDWLIAN
jgi:hypothetical protein